MTIQTAVVAVALLAAMSDEDEDLQSWGWTDLSCYSSSVSDSEKEQQIVSFLRAKVMSRRSLRLDEGLLDRSLPHGNASFSVGGGGSWSSRSLRSRRSQQHSVSCSESLLDAPHKPAGGALHNSSSHSVMSDASLLSSLLSSLLDESSIQERTQVDALWGLDHDSDPKESTIVAEENNTLIGPEALCTKHCVQALSRVHCEDRSAQGTLQLNTHGSSSSSKYNTSSSAGPGPSESGEPESSTIYYRDRNRTRRTARSGRSGVGMKEPTKKELQPNGSLSSILFNLAQSAARSVGPLSRRAGSASWRAGCSAARMGVNTCRWLYIQLRHKTTNKHLRWFPVFLVVLPLLVLLFSLLWFSSAGVQLVLPAVNITDLSTVVSQVPAASSNSFLPSESQSAEDAVEESKDVEPLYSKPPSAESAAGEEEVSAVVEDDERLVHLEQSLTALWERVEARGRRAEQRHRELLRFYTSLQQQQLSFAQSGGVGDAEARLSVLLDQQLSELRRQLDEERQQREEVRQQDLLQQQSQTSRLDQLELQLQKLAAKANEAQWRHEAAGTLFSPSPTTLPAALGVDQQSHDALLAEVARLETALVDVRRDVAGLSRCQDSCRQLTTIQQTISGQISTRVREEVRTLLYGNQLTAAGDAAGVPESVLQWLSERYVSEADLQAALASLERRILQNISLQLERQHSEETVREAVPHTAEGDEATVTREEVRVMVKNALRLFSEDRTGLADYALESGGGSILSTRCSETYQTKAALLSLFGVPLWYFSQSPRAVIQPDIHPGNCWAFSGSTGFLVIRLSMSIVPTAFTLEHIPKALSPSGSLHSAPRDFGVYGLHEESWERGKLLGTYTYDHDGDALQTFSVTEDNDEAFQIIEVQVFSNWGHEEYTCMYRFRVHGMPSDI